MAKARHGFSLVEVVMAIAVLAVAGVAVLGLLPSLARNAREASETLVVQRLPAAVETELVRLAHGGSLGALAARMGVEGGAPALRLVASRDGRRVEVLGETSLPAGEQFFLVEASRFPAAPLAFDATTAAVLPVRVRVAWPFRRPGPPSGTGAVEAADANRGRATFVVAVTR